MNDLLEQFIVECRELIDIATTDLLALETAPADKERLDAAFRGFHTLKGAAGIVDFAAMGQLLHAAEEGLAPVRAGSRAVSGDLISDCLACLDQVARWLDEIATAGEIPALPEDAAGELAARFAASDHPGSAPGASAVASASAPDWFVPFIARHPRERDQARTALRYVPAADCFLRGEDPLALVARMPDILALELVPDRPWPPLDELDPFACDLVITVLTATSPGDLRAMMRLASGDLEVLPLPALRSAGEAVLSPDALSVLEEQARLAANEATEGFAGRLASAGLVAANVLRRSGLPDAANVVSDAAEKARSEGSGAGFIAALRAVLARKADDAESRRETPGADDTDDFAARVQPARTLRVDVERIDALVSLAGELTVARNAMGHTARLAREGADVETLAQALKDQHALLDRLVSELRTAVLGIRVLPLRHVFQHFPRLVREMARDLGKQVRLIIDGETTEADKATVEALFEPLLHVSRNALDHGIEPAAERIAAGKPAEATLRFRAARNGDRVIIEVSDDGRGIDPAKLRLAAARRGLASEAALADMPDQAVLELIFSPGFSTATAVTGISGRGVGMDAVRSAITRLSGRVTVASEPGTGTTVIFTLPFTVLMLRVMTVEAGGQVFGVPIDAVVETTRVPRDRISRLGAVEAIVLRDRSVPLIRLSDILGVPANGSLGAAGDARIVVASVGDENGTEQLVALEVEAFGERMDVMLKPMEGLLAGVSGFAGTTLLGDGRVLIVLDLWELLR